MRLHAMLGVLFLQTMKFYCDGSLFNASTSGLYISRAEPTFSIPAANETLTVDNEVDINVSRAGPTTSIPAANETLIVARNDSILNDTSVDVNISRAGPTFSNPAANETLIATRNGSDSNVFFEAPDPAFVISLHLEKLMPYYLISASGSVAVLVSTAVLGFDIKLTAAKLSSSMFERAWASTKKVLRLFGSLILILLAINSWRSDLIAMRTANVSGFGEGFYAMCVVHATSSNLKSALAVWTAIGVQSPASVFSVKPKYAYFPECIVQGKIPVLPCGANWLELLKWCYLMILFPYYVFVRDRKSVV